MTQDQLETRLAEIQVFLDNAEYEDPVAIEILKNWHAVLRFNLHLLKTETTVLDHWYENVGAQE